MKREEIKMMQYLTKKINNKKGFTLIELIVVIAILGILALIAIPRLTGFQESSRQRADVNNARLIANAASIALADGETVGGGNTLSATNLSGYLDNWPTLQSAAGGTFTLVISGDDVSVTNGAATPLEIYPDTDAAFIP